MDIRKVYYINLDKNIKRKKHFEKNYYKNPIVIKNKTIPLQRVSGVLVKKIPKETNIRIGAYGCSLAHMKILKHRNSESQIETRNFYI